MSIQVTYDQMVEHRKILEEKIKYIEYLEGLPQFQQFMKEVVKEQLDATLDELVKGHFDENVSLEVAALRIAKAEQKAQDMKILLNIGDSIRNMIVQVDNYLIAYDKQNADKNKKPESDGLKKSDFFSLVPANDGGTDNGKT